MYNVTSTSPAIPNKSNSKSTPSEMFLWDTQNSQNSQEDNLDGALFTVKDSVAGVFPRNL